jgi:death on curing protein
MITFLTLDNVIEIHQNQIFNYGGNSKLRDSGLLSSALAQPSSMFHGKYLHNNIFEMAAAYLFHIVKNHPFIDGNKRTGIVSALIFLSINKIEIETSNKELELMVIAVASGKMNKTEISKWFEKYS